MMSRRFLYMVVEDSSLNPFSYTLHRINPSRLFYLKDSPERAAAAAAPGARATTMEAVAAAARGTTAARVDVEKARLPRPTITFSSPNQYMDFALSGNKDQIVAVARASMFRTGDEGCAPDRSILYDDAAHSVMALPGLTFPKRGAVPVAIGGDLYFVGVEEDDRGVEDVHRYGDFGFGGVSRDHRIFVLGLIRKFERYYQYPDWYWNSFAPPPYLGRAGETRKRHSEKDASYAVVWQVGGWHIWASMPGLGTYSMSTERGEWGKVSESALPFRGPAVYAPEHGLWFGFPSDYRYYYGGLLGAWDLHAYADAPVEASGAWGGIHAEAYRSYHEKSHLVHLGERGRFCVATLFEVPKPPPASRCARCYYDSDPPVMGFALLTGVEVERCDGGELRMIRHRSCKYSLGLNSARALL